MVTPSLSSRAGCVSRISVLGHAFFVLSCRGFFFGRVRRSSFVPSSGYFSSVRGLPFPFLPFFPYIHICFSFRRRGGNVLVFFSRHSIYLSIYKMDKAKLKPKPRTGMGCRV
ncbi:hypothetical protein K438DRAFT_773597 [Mycena galopus ATCC 62051]|nr:hypothetical protein K438DRAFT_773597 [Mycena galopus ATCC 62051]